MPQSARRNARWTALITRPQPWEAGHAVRRDWPDGTHDLVAYRADGVGWDHFFGRFIERDCEYWRWGPLRPDRWTVVTVSRRDFNLHAGRHNCRAPDCPTA